MQHGFTRAQILAADRPAFLLTLTWAGRLYRHATEVLDITDADGNTHSYVGGLPWPGYAEESSRSGGVDDAGPSVPIEVVLENVDVAEEMAARRWLDQATGELAFVLLDRSGQVLQTWEQRVVLVRGCPAQPVYGDIERPAGWCTFSLESQPYDDTATLLEPAAKIDSDTYLFATSARGKPFPIVIGTPGVFRTLAGASGTRAGSPAYPINYTGDDAEEVLICAEEVVATDVTIRDAAGSGAASPVTTAEDGKGRTVAIVDVSALSASIDLTSGEFWVTWDEGDGGLKNPFGDGVLERLGDVCAWALLRSKTLVDLPAWTGERGLLNRYRCALYINDPEMTPWEFVLKMTEDIPLEIRAGPDGVYPRALCLETDDADLCATIEEGADFYPVGPVTTETEPGDIVNRVSISYAPDGQSGAFQRTTTFTAARAITEVTDGVVTAYDPEQHPDEYAFVSQSLYGERGITLEVSWICDELTAATLARDILRARAFPLRRRDYIADFTWGWLRVGARVRFTSESLHLTDIIAEVSAKAWDGEGWAFTLTWMDDPVRDAGTQ